MKESDQFLTLDKKVYKLCPDCMVEIKPELGHCNEHECCPCCGCNRDD